MRNSLTLLSRTPAPSQHSRSASLGHVTETPPQFIIPTIRLTTATPSVHGSPADPAPLAPRDGGPRKRLVPKKSKLSLLGGGKTKEKPKDTLDPGHCANRSSMSSERSFEIYVDPTDDPDIGEIVVVRKKKSRGALDEVQWNASDSVNIDSSVMQTKSDAPRDKENRIQTIFKSKNDEKDKDKWWSIGRSKGLKKKQEHMRANSTPPQAVVDSSDKRQRAHSLDAGALLKGIVPSILKDEPEFAPERERPRQRTSTGPSLLSTCPSTLTSSGSALPGERERSTSGSIALRAMRSVRSMARIGSWAQLRNGVDELNEKTKETGKTKPKISRPTAISTRRNSSTGSGSSNSSFEAGAPTPKKAYIPSTLGRASTTSTSRIGTVRTVSSQSTESSSSCGSYGNSTSSNRTSGLSTSTSTSQTSSILSNSTGTITGNTVGGRSSKRRSDSSASVHWTDQTETVKDRRHRELEFEHQLQQLDSRRFTDPFRKPVVQTLFPAPHQSKLPSVQSSPRAGTTVKPILTLQTPTPEKQDSPSASPVKPARPRQRPVSDQSPVQMRKKRYGVVMDDDQALTALDAATADLANLINRLDLQATPDASPRSGTPANVNSSGNSSAPPFINSFDPFPLPVNVGVPFQIAPTKFDEAEVESPASSANVSPAVETPSSAKKNRTRKSLFNMSSVSSLRAFAQSIGKVKGKESTSPTKIIGGKDSPRPWSATMGQSIMAWPSADEEDEILDISKDADRTISLKHSSLPSDNQLRHTSGTHTHSAPSRFMRETTPEFDADMSMMSTTSRTFGRTPPVRTGDFVSGEERAEPESPTRTFRGLPKQFQQSQPSQVQQLWQQQHYRGMSVPIPSEYCHTWRRTNTGGSVGPDTDIYSRLPHDTEDDIPSELQNILARNEDEEGTISYRQRRRVLTAPLPSPGFPPKEPLPPPVSASAFAPLRMQQSFSMPVPVFRAPSPVDDHDCDAEVDADMGESACSSDSDRENETDTKQSFDFTGELRSLNETGASDRRSFVEQLETAFGSSPAFKVEIGSVELNRKLGISPISSTFESASASRSNTTSMFSHARTYSGDSSRPSSGTVSDSSASVFVARRKDFVFERPTKVDMSAPPTERKQPALLAKKSSIGLGSVFMSKESASSTAAVSAKKSTGKLNLNFKFGGAAQAEVSACASSTATVLIESKEEQEKKPRTLADIIPPLNNTTSPTPLFFPMVKDDNYVLQSLASVGRSNDRNRLDSNCSSRSRARQQALARLTSQSQSIQNTHSRTNSDVSFSGFSSFSEIRRGFEFGPNREPFYPPAKANTSNSSNDASNASTDLSEVEIGRHCEYVESPFSIASVSSYGRVTRSGARDPFDFGVPIPVRPPSMDMSMTVDDTFDFIHGRQRKRLDSDASSFYFNPMELGARRRSIRQKRYRDSMMSVTSGPPISLYNKKRGSMLRNEVTNDGGPVRADIGGIRAAWTRHRNEQFRHSFASDVSARQLGRPGLGDKMFESAHDYGAPLSSISASPSQRSEYSDQCQKFNRYSYDSILNEHKSSSGDSLFDDSGNRSSISSDIFGFGKNFSATKNCGLLLPAQYRPVSIFSTGSVKSPPQEEDTMISMLGGGHVRRRSLESSFEASPCMEAGRRIAHPPLPSRRVHFNRSVDHDQPSFESSFEKSRFLDDSFNQSSGSEQFGNLRMNLAKQGLLSRQSLEESCLSGEGEDSLTSYSLGVLRPPGPVVAAASREASRSRCSSFGASTGADTPPLSISGGSSVNSGSQYSIDVAQLNDMLSDASDAIMDAGTATIRARPRPRGQVHRSGLSFPNNRSSVYETIVEESGSPPRENAVFKAPEHKNEVAPKPLEPAIHIVQWDDDLDGLHEEDETGPVLRRFYALKNEAFEILMASKREWVDTPMSLFALQTFEPPRNPDGMKALLEHSKTSYGPLPSELRPRRTRTRTLSRPSPYPRSRKTSLASVHSNNEESARLGREMPILNVPPVPNINIVLLDTPVLAAPSNARVLKEVHVNKNTKLNKDGGLNIAVPALGTLKPMSPFKVDFPSTEDVKKGKGNMLGVPRANGGVRPRVGSNASRKSAKKRAAGGGGGASKPSMELKENSVKSSSAAGLLGQNESLRIVRPRPRGRPTQSSRHPQMVRF